MKSQSTDYPVVTQYDRDNIAVPINIVPFTKADPMGKEPITGYGYELLIVPGKDAASQETYVNTVQALLDLKAQALGYDNIISICTYSGSSNDKFSAEGKTAMQWRDSVWGKCYEILSEVQAGKRKPPTISELVSELPLFEDIK